MSHTKHILARGRFLLPLSDCLGRERRIQDGYILSEEDRIKEADEYSPETGRRIIKQYRDDLRILGLPDQGKLDEERIPMLNGVILPGFIKAHGHDHESPIMGIAKDKPLTVWLEETINLFMGFISMERESLFQHFGKSPNLIPYLKGRLDDLQYGITSSLVNHTSFNLLIKK